MLALPLFPFPSPNDLVVVSPIVLDRAAWWNTNLPSWCQPNLPTNRHDGEILRKRELRLERRAGMVEWWKILGVPDSVDLHRTADRVFRRLLLVGPYLLWLSDIHYGLLAY